jgi:CheY-like chemotaxis protein
VDVCYDSPDLLAADADDGVSGAAGCQAASGGSGLDNMRARARPRSWHAQRRPGARRHRIRGPGGFKSGRLIRVVLVDDQALVRLGMRTLVDVEPDLELCGEADDGVTSLELIAAQRPDVVLLDMRMPRMDGLEVLRRMDLEAITTRVIILTTFEVDDYVFKAMRASASGFLTKAALPLACIRTSLLTEREREIVGWVGNRSVQ